MPNQVSIYEPRTMGLLVERTPEVKTFFRTMFFKNVVTFNTKSVDVDFKKGSRALAPFVHQKVGGKTVPNTGYQTKTYKPPLLAPNKVTTVDSLLNREPGETLVSGKSPAERAVDKLASDFNELKDMIARREEWMCAQAIFTGEIPVKGEGVDEVINFDFENFEVLDGKKKWNDSEADPIADIKRWHKEVQKKGFVNCDVCVMADDVADAFVKNEKVQKVLDIKGYDIAVIKPRELPNGATYIGTIRELGLDIYKYNEWYLDEDKNLQPLVPDGSLAMLSSKANYSMAYGAITLLNEDGVFITVEGKAVPDTWIERNPSRRFLQLNSSPLPVPHEVDSWYVASVL